MIATDLSGGILNIPEVQTDSTPMESWVYTTHRGDTIEFKVIKEQGSVEEYSYKNMQQYGDINLVFDINSDTRWRLYSNLTNPDTLQPTVDDYASVKWYLQVTLTAVAQILEAELITNSNDIMLIESTASKRVWYMPFAEAPRYGFPYLDIYSLNAMLSIFHLVDPVSESHVMVNRNIPDIHTMCVERIVEAKQSMSRIIASTMLNISDDITIHENDGNVFNIYRYPGGVYLNYLISQHSIFSDRVVEQHSNVGNYTMAMLLYNREQQYSIDAEISEYLILMRESMYYRYSLVSNSYLSDKTEDTTAILTQGDSDKLYIHQIRDIAIPDSIIRYLTLSGPYLNLSYHISKQSYIENSIPDTVVGLDNQGDYTDIYILIPQRVYIDDLYQIRLCIMMNPVYLPGLLSKESLVTDRVEDAVFSLDSLPAYKILYINKQLRYYIPISETIRLYLQQDAIYKPYVLGLLHSYLTNLATEDPSQMDAQDTHTFIIKAKIIQELKQYIDTHFEIDNIDTYYKLETRLSGSVTIEIKAEVYNTLVSETSTVPYLPENVISTDTLIPGNEYTIKLTATAIYTNDYSFDEVESIIGITEPIHFGHNVTTINQMENDYRFLVDWNYGIDGVVNKDIDKYKVFVYDEIPTDPSWDYTNSPNNPVQKPDDDSTIIPPLGTDEYAPGDTEYSIDKHSYILNPFKPPSYIKDRHYRWVQVQALIAYNPGYIKYKEE